MIAPEAAWAVGMLTRCLAYPSLDALQSAERALIYLYVAHVKDKVKITYERTSTKMIGARMLAGASDASFQVEHSTSGYEFEQAKAAIAWCVKKQTPGVRRDR